MKKVILLAIFILVIAGIAGVGYFYYRMNFANTYSANIYVDISPNETLRYYIEKAGAVNKYNLEVTDVSIKENFWTLSPSTKSKIKERVKQAVEKEFNHRLRDSMQSFVSGFFIECGLLVLPTQVIDSKYINQAKVSTEECYVKEEEKYEEFSNREYTIIKGERGDLKVDIWNIITELPYCLDFCDGKRVKKGEVIEAVALAEYLSKGFFEEKNLKEKIRVNYKVSKIDWNTVTFKIYGLIEPYQLEKDKLTLQGEISGYAVYDREKRLFTSLFISLPVSLSREFSNETSLLLATVRVKSKFNADVKFYMKMEIDK